MAWQKRKQDGTSANQRKKRGGFSVQFLGTSIRKRNTGKEKKGKKGKERKRNTVARLVYCNIYNKDLPDGFTDMV